MSIEWSRLTEPFPAGDVEWRVSRTGKNNNGVWAKVLAYITARAIHERLDEVFGPGGWKNEFREGPSGGVICRIYFRGDGGEWVWREDGAENTDIEAVKGGLSSAMKRAGAVLGIGRYLYHLDEGWANVHDDGDRYGRLPKDKGGDSFHWDPPALPEWALPGGKGRPTRADELPDDVDTETGEITDPDPEPEKANEEDVSRLQALYDMAKLDNRLTPDQSDRIKEGIDSEEQDKVHRCLDWLRTKLREEKDGADSESEEEQGSLV